MTLKDNLACDDNNLEQASKHMSNYNINSDGENDDNSNRKNNSQGQA